MEITTTSQPSSARAIAGLSSRRRNGERLPHRTTATVALGGGGARGLAHLGVMEALGESGVQTERIVGVSIGSLIGGLCAVDADIKRVQAAAIELLHSPVFAKACGRLMGSASRVSSQPDESSVNTRSVDWLGQWYGRLMRVMQHGHRLTRLVRSPAILSNQILHEAIEALIPDIDLRDTRIPLSVVAVDLKSGHRVVLERGPLRQAILASTAIPGFFPPVPWDDMLLSDVGVLDSIPLSIARSYGSDLTIGVDVGGAVERMEHFGSAIDVVMRMEAIGERFCRRSALKYADLVIHPAVDERPWYDFTDPHRLIEAGLQAARRALRQRAA
jgi:NTE family protein